jgi:hypothetical protein
MKKRGFGFFRGYRLKEEMSKDDLAYFWKHALITFLLLAAFFAYWFLAK